MKQQLLNFQVLNPKKASFISLTTRHRYSTTDCWASCVVLIVLVIAIAALGHFAILGAVGWLNHEVENQFLRAARVPVAEGISQTLQTPVQAKQELDEQVESVLHVRGGVLGMAIRCEQTRSRRQSVNS